MKSKTKLITFLAIAMLSSMFMVSNASAACNLPATATVSFEENPGPIETRLPGTATLSGVGDGYDITDGPTIAYCTELGVEITEGFSYTATLVCTDYIGSPWNEINYLLNTYEDSLDLQMAIWLLLGNSVEDIEAGSWPDTTNAEDLYTEAMAHDDYDPGVGDWTGVRCIIDDQDLLIKIEQECERSPGLTPGFWKNNLAVYLEVAKGNRGYSDPTGSPTVTKEGMATFFDGFDYEDLGELYRQLCPQLDGITADIRNDAANIFNNAAGLANL